METIKYGIGLSIGAFIALIGGWDVNIEVLLIIMGLDVITGVVRAAKQKDIASTAAFDGIVKKFIILTLVVLSYQGSRLIGDNVLRNTTIYSFCFTEGVSVMENAAAMKVIVPESLWAFFRQTAKKKFKDEP